MFQSTDPQKAKIGRGHVGIFYAMDGDRAWVLGGNQNSDAGHHEVSMKRMRLEGKSLILHSFRSLEQG